MLYKLDTTGVSLLLTGTGLAGGLLGAGVGAVIGWAIKTERWEEVPLDRLQLNMVPLRDGGFALGVSVTF